MKSCRKCSRILPLSEFFRDAAKRDGLRGVCKKCDMDQAVAYMRSHPERMRIAGRAWRQRNKDRCRAIATRFRIKNRATALICSARNRAKAKRIPFDLDEHRDEIRRRVSAGVCELTGVQLDASAMRKWNSPSIDRIDPSKGYVITNIRIVCYAINMALGTWGERVTRDLVVAWLKNKPSPAVSSS